MDAATPLSRPTPQLRYMDVLVESSNNHELAALETIREAGQSQGNATEEASLSPKDTAAARDRQLVTRVPTPERIRRASARLYNDIHAIMDRHDARTGRELKLRRRTSRAAGISYLAEQPRSLHQKTAVAPHISPAAKTALPNVHQLFEESRRAHLAETQQQRTYFPSSSKPTAYSTKNPSTFSYRFQSPPSAGSTA
ncbi:hypothetical protein, unknown function [Leishmania mexicana MHOM/GT/2001/U1103]|uniref:Uncharacterized protein n=1 Tax=Leishmania mexicana (strain MHOM/GT/2001/U1103) TaxID=929439 RepID=E9AP41_LEIMU|nr:hypothetical protein, unknown function [Leishmania mexicana MHOM/GT/2001/U1103]CBZ24705.1 hypothetical protein, unknown function [Leishmania mexicana MHOM/GT/2001/U1103]